MSSWGSCTGWGCFAGKQLCREGPWSPGKQQAAHEPASALMAKAIHSNLGISSNDASTARKVILPLYYRWGPTWSTVASLGFLVQARHGLNKSSKGPRIWLREWSSFHKRRGEESWNFILGRWMLIFILRILSSERNKEEGARLLSGA